MTSTRDKKPSTDLSVRVFSPMDTEAVIALWHDCDLTRPWNDPYHDIARKLSVQPQMFLVAVDRDAIVGSVMAGYDGHRGWVNYLAVAPSHRRYGIARMLMQHVEEMLKAMGCPKINLQIRANNEAVVGFYRAIGYHVDEVTSMGRRLIPD
jgi:ribosomal protein S18 acetylase RimI-like enzyme